MHRTVPKGRNPGREKGGRAVANQDVTKKAPIDLLCLSLLCEKDRYGYEMSQEISSRSGGLLSIPEAAVYMAMYRLVDKGLATDRREVVGGEKSRIRVYYHITESGRTYLEGIAADYDRVIQGVQRFLAESDKAK